MTEHLEKVIIQNLSIKDSRVIDTKKGKQTIHPFSIQVKGNWFSGTAWTDEEKKQYQKLIKGSQHLLIFYKKGDYWNFKFPSRIDVLEDRVNKLEEKLNNLNSK